MPDTPAALLVDERAAAYALSISVYFLRKDRRTHRRIPFIRVGGAIRYNLENVRKALEALEEGGATLCAQGGTS